MNPGPSKMFTVPFICGLNRKIAIIHIPDRERCLKGGLVIPGTLLLAFSVWLFVHFSYRRSRKSLETGFPASAVSKKLHLFDLFSSCKTWACPHSNQSKWKTQRVRSLSGCKLAQPLHFKEIPLIYTSCRPQSSRSSWEAGPHAADLSQ